MARKKKITKIKPKKSIDDTTEQQQNTQNQYVQDNHHHEFEAADFYKTTQTDMQCDEPLDNEIRQENVQGPDMEHPVNPDQSELVEQCNSVVPVSLEYCENRVTDTPKIVSLREAGSVLEALLFATNEPLTLNRLEKLTGLSKRTIRALVLQLQLEYHRNSGGLQIIEVAGGYQMATRPECHPWLAELAINRSRNKDNLSVAALETLAIIAYKQPVTRLEIDSIRGVDSSGTIRKLIDVKLVKVIGRTPPPQRAHQYGTTKSFLMMFGLKSIKELPSLTELKELMGIKVK